MDDQARERFLEEAVGFAIASYENFVWRAAAKSDSPFYRWRHAQAAIPNRYYLRGVLVQRHGLEALVALVRIERLAFEDLVWDLIHEDLLLHHDEEVVAVAKAVLVVCRQEDAKRAEWALIAERIRMSISQRVR